MPLLPVRADLDDVEPYSSPQHPARYRLNTNESPYPAPDVVLRAVADATSSVDLNRYPERDSRPLLEALGEYNGWSPDGVWVANGSNEVFLHLFLAYGGPERTVLTFEPSYPLHVSIPRITGTRVVRAHRTQDLQIDKDAAVGAIRELRPDVTIVCSPNNPNGGTSGVGTIQAMLEVTHGLVIVDEAYIEFADARDTVRGLLHEHPNLVITRTFSKAWRLAGMRIGYMLALPEVVEGLHRVRLPYHLSTLTQAAAVAALAATDETMELAERVAGERDRLSVELQTMGVPTFPSKANFVLFKVDDPDRVWHDLLEVGILIRNYSHQPDLERCLRVTAGLPEENDAFLGAMREVLDA